MRVAVLGAGYMGGAITFPLADNGNEVHLWGTWLDAEIIAACRTGMHPKLNKALPARVRLFMSEELAPCIRGADAIVLAVASEVFVAVFERLLDALKEEGRADALRGPVFVALTKGLAELDGTIGRISELARQMFLRTFPEGEFLWASAGGPVKAVELSHRMPTATVYGLCAENLGEMLSGFGTDYYRISRSNDVVGVELCSALKNVYAIGMGLCDGLKRNTVDRVGDNTRAWVFELAVSEMVRAVELAGGRGETVGGLAGIGDLYVTAASGRNREYGERIAGGVGPEEALRLMLAGGQIAEGYYALRQGRRYLGQYTADLAGRLPLFHFLHKVIVSGMDPERGLRSLLREI